MDVTFGRRQNEKNIFDPLTKIVCCFSVSRLKNLKAYNVDNAIMHSLVMKFINQFTLLMSIIYAKLIIIPLSCAVTTTIIDWDDENQAQTQCKKYLLYGLYSIASIFLHFSSFVYLSVINFIQWFKELKKNHMHWN